MQPSPQPLSFVNLEELVRHTLNRRILTAVEAQRLHQLLVQRALSPREQRLIDLLQDAIANRHIQVTPLG